MENQSNQIQSSIGETFQTQFTEELPVTGLIPAPISTENQVEERSRIDIGIPNGQIMTGERFTLSPLQNYHAVNSYNQWNSRLYMGHQPNQLFARDVNDQHHNPNYMQYIQIYNHQNNNYRPQVAVPNGYWEQVVGSLQFSRSEQLLGIQTHQVAPAYANRITTQFGQATLVLESSFLRAPPSNSFLNISNQNATVIIPSAVPYNAIIPQQNQRQNLQIGGELENVAARNYRVNEGRKKQARGNRQLEIGEGSSSKRQKINSPPRGIGGTGPASQQQSSNSGANAVGMQNQRNNGAYNNAAANVGMQNQGNNGAYNNATANVGMQNQGNNDADNPVEHARYSLYDPQFENLGLAIDPHLRIFLASKGNFNQ